MNQALKQTPSLRDRIVEVLREHREVMRIGELADKLEAALSTIEPACCGKPVHVGSPEAYTLECCGNYIQPAPSVAMKARKPKLPPVGNELYEHYPSMSAQTHAEAVKDYARTAVASALSAQVQDMALLTPEEQKAQASRCGCKGIDDYCPCQNVVDADTRELRRIDAHLQKLIEADMHKARMASNNEKLRLWFVAELISEASGSVPLLEIEGLVARRLAAVQGGEV